MLGMQARNLLLGAAASQEVREMLQGVVRSFPEVTHVVRLLSMHMGSHSILVTGELEVGRSMTTEQIEDLLTRIDGRIAETVPDVTETFWELRRRS